jgi:hypothetical protein
VRGRQVLFLVLRVQVAGWQEQELQGLVAVQEPGGGHYSQGSGAMVLQWGPVPGVRAAQDRLHPLRVMRLSVWKITRTAEPEL